MALVGKPSVYLLIFAQHKKVLISAHPKKANTDKTKLSQAIILTSISKYPRRNGTLAFPLDADPYTVQLSVCEKLQTDVALGNQCNRTQMEQSCVRFHTRSWCLRLHRLSL